MSAVFQTSALVPATYSKSESCDQGRASGKGEVKKDLRAQGHLVIEL